MIIRQGKARQTPITIHPSTSLHLVQISKFIQDYQHTRMLYNLNLNAAIVQFMLPQLQESQLEGNLSLDVPYIQSQHFQSNDTFKEQQFNHHFVDEKFSDEEEQNIGDEPTYDNHCKIVLKGQQQDFAEQDFKFVSKQSMLRPIEQQASFSSTSHSQVLSYHMNSKQEEIEIHRLQESAYFSQTPHQQSTNRIICENMNESTKENKPETINRKQQTQASYAWSKKAMFLTKIQKEKSRKEIAQLINRQRHHLKRFLK